jgi:hypothetical protein
LTTLPKTLILNYLRKKMVASPGIEPGSGASETLILSIVLRGHSLFYKPTNIAAEYFDGNGKQNYAKEFTYRN